MLQLSEMVSSGIRPGNTTIETKFYRITSPSQTTFILSSSVKSNDHVFVFINGEHLSLTNYNVNKDVLSIINYNLNINDIVYIVHFKSVTVSSKTFDKNIEEFVGGNLVYQLTNPVSDPKNIIVTINGLIQEPSRYRIENEKTIIFTSLPPADAIILIIYLTGAIITTTSVIPGSVTLQHLAIDSVDTRYAIKDETYTRNEIDNKITKFVNDAPELLNSLSEIAKAINNDPNFANTIQNQLNSKSPIQHNHSNLYYSKSEVDVFLLNKASKTEYYNAGQIETILGEKANLSDVYTKTEVATLISSGGTVTIPKTPGNRGLFSGGLNSIQLSNIIEYFSINTFGNSVKFGELSESAMASASSSNGIGNTGLIGGGFTDKSIDTIQKVNMLNTENASLFGKLSSPRSQHTAVNNGTNNRTVWIGGTGGFLQDMEFTTTNVPGNAALFGNILGLAKLDLAGTSNGRNDRGVFAVTIHPNTKVSQFITIPTLSNSVVFGECDSGISLAASSNDNHDRGIFAGGLDNGTITTNAIKFINIAIQGSALNFGTLTIPRSGLAATSNGVNQRAIFAGGINSDTTYSSETDFITISVNSNAAPFGDLISLRARQSAMSNAQL